MLCKSQIYIYFTNLSKIIFFFVVSPWILWSITCLNQFFSKTLKVRQRRSYFSILVSMFVWIPYLRIYRFLVPDEILACSHPSMSDVSTNLLFALLHIEDAASAARVSSSSRNEPSPAWSRSIFRICNAKLPSRGGFHNARSKEKHEGKICGPSSQLSLHAAEFA